MTKTYGKFLKESEGQYLYIFDMYKRFLKNFNELLKLKKGDGVSGIELIRNKLTKNTIPCEHQWLTEKYAELSAGKTRLQ